MQVHLTALGCRLNEAELERWARAFQEQGYEIARETAGADLIVVNTCAVTQEAVRKSRKLLRRAQRQNPQAKLVVSGCFATLEPLDPSGIDLLVPNQDKDRLVEIAIAALDLPSMSKMAPDSPPLFSRGRHRAFVKVQDGCRHRCSFCVVTLARGEERSRKLDSVIAEINTLVEEGVQEAVLSGVHLGGWGNDFGLALPDLIEAVLRHTDLPRLRLGSLEPWGIADRFWALFENPRCLPHLHLPLQSGSDRILRRMARRCRRADFLRLVQQARDCVPDLNLSTDIIVGFPGETEGDWRQTLELVESVGFSQVHTFLYSPRRGTKAAELPDPVPPAIQRARSRAMHELVEDMRRRIFQAQLGRTSAVLIEGPFSGNRAEWFGYTANYLPVRLRLPAGDWSNRILEVPLELHPEGAHLYADLLGQRHE